ncbi:N/A [soil metagenome]
MPPLYPRLLAKLGSNGRLIRPPSDVRTGGCIVGIANQKGGVGKTTTTVNLAAGLALRGRKVLVVDVDPQCNATTGLGVDHRGRGASAYDLLIGGVSLADVVVGTALEGLTLVPASIDLAGAEVELAGALRRELKLREALAGARAEYDIMLVDCPPSLGLLTVNALAAADDLVPPVQCEYYALEGLGQLLGNAERVRQALNPGLSVTGFIMTMYDGRTKLSSQVTSEMRSHFCNLVLRTVIPRSVRISEAPSYGEPVLTLDPSARGAGAYRALAGEVDERYGLVMPRASAEEAGSQRTDEPSPPEAPSVERATTAPGPTGRGYGTTTSVPPGLEHTWPVPEPWSGT